MSATTNDQAQGQPTDQADLDSSVTTARLLRCLARFMSWAPQTKQWPMDLDGRPTYLKVPITVCCSHVTWLHWHREADLQKSEVQKGLYGGQASIANLPPELHCLILSQLEPVDRICLALTCKSITSSALASQLLKVPSWSTWLSLSEGSVPPQEILVLRLAHGWFDKAKYRYCSQCKKILPRDLSFWRNKLHKKKRLPFHLKVRAEEDDWYRLSRNGRYEHIIDIWCHSRQADSSIFSCASCLPKQTARFSGDLEKGFARTPNIFEAPVECPCCVEKSITHTYRQPHKPKIRPKLWRCTRWTLSLVGNTLLVVVYLIYVLLKLPIDIGAWLWKKYKRNRVSTGRKFWCLV